MIIIPEIETVVILVPRTGTTALKKAVKDRYPESMLLYRHMEADGIPRGYERWRKVGVIREPTDRLISLYKYLKTFDGKGKHALEYVNKMNRSVDMPFDRWLIENEIVFTSPYDSSGRSKYYPFYTVMHPLPENRKSQLMYLRPDLGTIIYRYDKDLGLLENDLEIKLDMKLNSSEYSCSLGLDNPELAVEYIEKWFHYDLEYF